MKLHVITPSSVVTRKETVYVSSIMSLHVGTDVRISWKEYKTIIPMSYTTNPVKLESKFIEFGRQ